MEKGRARTAVIKARMRQSEMRDLKRDAARAGLTVSEYVRDKVFTYIRREAR